MDIVLGVSMAPSTVCCVLVEGENADGVTVEEDEFEVDATDGSPTTDAADRVIAAILGTRESAAEGDYHLKSTGVTWTDPVEAAVLRDALAARKVPNVMLVSAFLAAAALAQSVGSAVGYAQTGLLFLEPDTATLAVVDSADGSIAELRRQTLRSADEPIELAAMVAGLDAPESRPDGVFVVGCGVDITTIKPQLETATALPILGPEDPESALARGAALASANAPLFASSTAAFAYSQFPDWTTAGVIDPHALDADSVGETFAYGATTDGDALVDNPGRKAFLVALSVMTVFFVGVMALVISLGLSIRPTVTQRPSVGENLIVPATAAPPVPKAEVPTPPAGPPLPQAPPEAVPAPEAPPPAPEAAPLAPAPEAPVPAPVPEAPVPAPAPAAIIPAPEAPAALAPAIPAPALAPAIPAPAPAARVPAPAARVPAPAAPAAPVPIPRPGVPVFPVLPPIHRPPAAGAPVLPGGGGWQPGRGAWQPGGDVRGRGGWQPGHEGWQPGGGFGNGGFGPNFGGGGHGGGFGGRGHDGGFGGLGGGGHGGGFGGFGGGHGGFGGH